MSNKEESFLLSRLILFVPVFLIVFTILFCNNLIGDVTHNENT